MVDKKHEHAAFLAANPTFKPVGMSLDSLVKKLKTGPVKKRPRLLGGDDESTQD